MNQKIVKQQVVLGAVIFQSNGKALIVKRHESQKVFPDLWEIPSGKKIT